MSSREQPPSTPPRRPTCEACSRPQKTCICDLFLSSPLHESPVDVLLLQHPKERKRKNRTDEVLLRTLKRVTLKVSRTLRDTSELLDALGASADANKKATTDFTKSVNLPQLNAGNSTTTAQTFVADSDTPRAPSHTVEVPSSRESRSSVKVGVLFPCAHAQVLRPKHRSSVDVLVAVDATWQFAKEMFNRSDYLRSLPAFTLDTTVLTTSSSSSSGVGSFVIRKPPRAAAQGESVLLSTAEAVALAADILATASPASGSRHAPQEEGEGVGQGPPSKFKESRSDEGECEKAPLGCTEAASEALNNELGSFSDVIAAAAYPRFSRVSQICLELSRRQLEFAGRSSMKHCLEKKGYVPDLYKQACESTTPQVAAWSDS